MTDVGAAIDAGDDDALYRLYADELIRYATALVGRADAGDVVIDAVVACFARPEWRSMVDRRAYLYRAVFNRAISVRRSDTRRHRREQMAPARPAQDDGDLSIDAESALGHLSPQQRAVVYFTYWHDLSPVDIARLMAVSEGTVRKQLTRARTTLRGILR